MAMVTVSDIKEALPGWPDEVVSEWLLYFANDIGWPPPNPFGAHRWGRILGNRPLSWWAEVTWNSDSVDCGLNNMSERTRNLVGQIIADIANGTADEVTSRKYNHPFKYIMENGSFPNPMVAMRAPDGLSFLDGHHRLAAFTDLQKIPSEVFEKRKLQKPSRNQQVWIGTHPEGELPLV
jgi:hypothetical protein